MKEDDVGGTCSTNAVYENAYRLLDGVSEGQKVTWAT
jgi:hypothetical protein